MGYRTKSERLNLVPYAICDTLQALHRGMRGLDRVFDIAG